MGTAALLLAVVSGSAVAQNTPAQRADQLNSAGKQLFVKKQYRAAAEKFYQATILSPEGRLYWNLCLTRVQLNRPRAALTACLAVEPNGAKDRVIVKSRKMIAELKAKGITPADKPTNADGSEKTPDKKPDATPVGTNGTDTNGTGTNGTGTSGTGTNGTGTNGTDTGTNTTGFQPNRTGHETSVDDPDNSVSKAPALRYDYSWSLAFELGSLFNSTLGGKDTENYDTGGPALRFHADFLLSKKSGLGGQGYLHINSINEGVQAARLQVFDAGGAIYKHFHTRGKLYITPLAGAHLAVMQPDSGTNSSVVFALGFRGAIQAGLVFGRRDQYMFTVSLEYTRYLSAISESSNIDPMFYGLDQGSHTFALAAGLKMRFDTPFGATSIFTLE